MEVHVFQKKSFKDSLHEGLKNGPQLKGDTCKGSVSITQCLLHRSSCVPGTAHRDFHDQDNCTDGPSHQPISTGPRSAVLPHLQLLEHSRLGLVSYLNLHRPMEWKTNDSGHFTPLEDERRNFYAKVASCCIFKFNLPLRVLWRFMNQNYPMTYHKTNDVTWYQLALPVYNEADSQYQFDKCLFLATDWLEIRWASIRLNWGHLNAILSLRFAINPLINNSDQVLVEFDYMLLHRSISIWSRIVCHQKVTFIKQYVVS